MKAILSGLLKRPTPGYLIHLSGTGIVSDWAEDQYLGKRNPKVWSDISSLDEIKRLPAHALHRNTETILHDTMRDHGNRVNIAIMCPPDIYGKGKGPGKTQSAYLPMFVNEIRSLGGRAFYYGDGMNTRSWVHIEDLMRVYVKVVEAAASGYAVDYFNSNGYYFAGTQEHTQLDVARATGQVLYEHGVIPAAEPVSIDLTQLDSMANIPGFPRLARYLFASNSRSRPERAEKLFGYAPKATGLMETLESDIVQVLTGP